MGNHQRRTIFYKQLLRETVFGNDVPIPKFIALSKVLHTDSPHLSLAVLVRPVKKQNIVPPLGIFMKQSLLIFLNAHVCC